MLFHVPFDLIKEKKFSVPCWKVKYQLHVVDVKTKDGISALWPVLERDGRGRLYRHT